jgi:hypothetical protein
LAHFSAATLPQPPASPTGRFPITVVVTVAP